MFDHTYPFKFVNIQPKKATDSYLEVYIYTFLSKGEKYIFKAERYQYNTLAIKFYPKRFEHSTERYALLTQQQEASRILGTCLAIMVDLYHKLENASFIFTGAPLSIEEDRDHTKRYRLYKKIMEAKFSPTQFSHHTYQKISAYLLLNRDNPEKELLRKLEKLFGDIYEVGEKEE